MQRGSMQSVPHTCGVRKEAARRRCITASMLQQTKGFVDAPGVTFLGSGRKAVFRSCSITAL